MKKGFNEDFDESYECELCGEYHVEEELVGCDHKNCRSY